MLSQINKIIILTICSAGNILNITQKLPDEISGNFVLEYSMLLAFDYCKKISDSSSCFIKNKYYTYIEIIIIF